MSSASLAELLVLLRLGIASLIESFSGWLWSQEVQAACARMAYYSPNISREDTRTSRPARAMAGPIV